LAKDDRVAARLYQLAAEDGDSWGQYNLGRFHQYGRGGLPQNDEEAARLYRLAAEQGHGAGQFTLGVLYEEGRGGLPRDDAEAARLYRLSAEQGGPYAQYRLAMFYEEGLGGLQKNIGEATRLYKLAAEQDSYLAAKRQASDALKRLGAATAAVSPSAPTNRARAAMPVIGILNWGFPNRDADALVAFRQGLAKAGYIEGRNTAIEYRWASAQTQRLPALAMDLVQRGVALIVAVGAGRVAHEANAATSKIPIVAEYPGDMVKDDLVASLNQPGRNITGVTDGNTQLGGKRLSLLRELVPEATTFGFLAGGRADRPHPALWDSYEEQTSNILAAAREIGREVIILEAPSDRDYEAALATLVQRHARALVVGAFSFRNIDKLLGLAARYKIPTIYPGRGYVVAGGLLGYFPDTDEVFRQIGIYAGQILKGTRPSDLPVVQPTKYVLVINLKTAKALGLTIPETLLATADEVIQ
jgi:putative ABC transport system substrate-binding protein